ncbi:hypothetical protein GGR52DRAFT_190876 [Hypoxylon sp. FL1284]|nr:hypothetical protein GGR52DRAFT_190876 [Hypoxylon sp. FL1284]
MGINAYLYHIASRQCRPAFPLKHPHIVLSTLSAVRLLIKPFRSGTSSRRLGLWFAGPFDLLPTYMQVLFPLKFALFSFLSSFFFTSLATTKTKKTQPAPPTTTTTTTAATTTIALIDEIIAGLSLPLGWAMLLGFLLYPSGRANGRLDGLVERLAAAVAAQRPLSAAAPGGSAADDDDDSARPAGGA